MSDPTKKTPAQLLAELNAAKPLATIQAELQAQGCSPEEIDAVLAFIIKGRERIVHAEDHHIHRVREH